MTSIKELVTFQGRLRGESYEADCTVSATKVSLSGSSTIAYTNYRIVSVAKSLPDGRYELSANGEITALRYHTGQWLAAHAF